LKEQVWLVRFDDQIRGKSGILRLLCQTDSWASDKVSRVDVIENGSALLYGQKEAITRLRRHPRILSVKIQEGDLWTAVLCFHTRDWIRSWRDVKALLQEWLILEDVMAEEVIESDQDGATIHLVCELGVVQWLQSVYPPGGGRIECIDVMRV
jgi:hypothetical protein